MRAQRIRPVAPVGSLLKGSQPKKVKKVEGFKTPRLRVEEHLEAIRQCPCLSCGRDPSNEAAHVRMADAEKGKRHTGMSEKPGDFDALPLCRWCHQDAPNAQHKIGEKPFWRALGLDPIELCQRLRALSPNTEAMRALCFVRMTIR